MKQRLEVFMQTLIGCSMFGCLALFVGFEISPMFPTMFSWLWKIDSVGSAFGLIIYAIFALIGLMIVIPAGLLAVYMVYRGSRALVKGIPLD
ncbi:hypothetical protein [Dokdonella soli]|uniref:Uncharacterized protein n=1 Tax=Dokdonella soli TaxID=529810 RepID=A0ABN1IMQ4_9GAMM